MEQILIVEDDATLNQGLCKALKSADRQIVSCGNLKEAKAQLAVGTVSVVLLDINLPDGSGIDLLRIIKADNPMLPVILLTANDTDRDIVSGLEQGADDYITKPFSLAVLHARVNTQLRKSKANKPDTIFVDGSYDLGWRYEFNQASRRGGCPARTGLYAVNARQNACPRNTGQALWFMGLHHHFIVFS